jgi:hypothetical protein
MEERTESEGPSPNPSDQDALEELEEEIEQMDRPLGAEDHTTAEEGLEGDTLDERLAREVPDRGGRRPEEPTAIVEEDEPDDEPELVGELGEAEDIMSPEEAAMHVRDRAPGATDHPDDYVDE